MYVYMYIYIYIYAFVIYIYIYMYIHICLCKVARGSSPPPGSTAPRTATPTRPTPHHYSVLY